MGIEIFANYASWTVDPGSFAAEMEAVGFDGVSASDHFFRTAAYPHLWVSLATMAAATRRVRLASAFANNLFRSPVEFVQASLTLHAVSGGRFEAGLGAGWLAPEVRGAGLTYPDPPARARRFLEGVTIAGELLRTGRCRYEGEFFDIDVPVVGPIIEHADAPSVPPLVASLGGPWTIRHIAPLVDRVELKVGASTRGGSLDLSVLAGFTLDSLRAQVELVREVAPSVPIGSFAMIAVGDDDEVAPYRERLGDGLYGTLVGSPSEVRDGLESFALAGVTRVQVSELLKGSLARLATTF